MDLRGKILCWLDRHDFSVPWESIDGAWAGRECSRCERSRTDRRPPPRTIEIVVGMRGDVPPPC